MNFKFAVKTLTESFQFNPTELAITVNNIPNDDLNIRINTVLTQYLEDGSIVENRTRVLPKSFLDVISGFDYNTLQPSVDNTMMNEALVAFGLELDIQ